MNRLRHWSLWFVLTVLLASCSNVGYYVQAIGGHLELMRATQPISDVMQDPAGDPALAKKLAEVQTMREFASRELGLPDNNSYRSYADVKRPYVVWNVFAAPEFSLEPKRWCVPVAGCVNYRGYYDREDAERLAAELREEGYDTYVGGVAAYSTLGYFDDPVLNTFLRLGTLEVARIVFHELAHQLIYVPDDSTFNESFATTVEKAGMRRWLARHGTPEQRAKFELQQERKAAFTGLIRDGRNKAVALYASNDFAERKRDAKSELFGALRQDYTRLKAGWGGYSGYDRFFGEGLNNAKLASLALYSELVPAFDRLLEIENDDLPRFYRRVTTLAALDKEARRRTLADLVPASRAATQLHSEVAAAHDDRNM